MTEDRITRPDGDVLSRICEEIFELPQQDDEFTATEVCDRLNINYKKAEYRLKKMENEGVLTSRRAKDRRGYTSRLYKYVEDNEQ